MKTIELKWIEDDNHIVAEDAYNGLKELIETGVFPNLTVNCEDDTLYITGEQDDLDKAVLKIQRAYSKYGQIMMKEAKNGTTEVLRIESFDDNVQDIFNHTLDDYNKFKSSKERPLNYVKQLNDYRFKFKKFYETAARSDKKLLKPYLDEISNLLDESEIVNKIKPIKKIDEGKLIDAGALNVMMELIDLGYPSEAASKLIKKYTNFINQELKDGAEPFWIAKLIEDDLVNNKYSDRDDEELVKESKEICEAAGKKVVNPENVDTIEDVEKELQELGYNECQAKGLVKEYFKKAWRKLASGECAMNVAIDIDEEYMKESVDNELTKHLGNLKNWGIVEDELDEDYNFYRNRYRQMAEKRKRASEEKKKNEKMTRFEYNDKFERVARMYAEQTGKEVEDVYDELMDIDELPEYVDSDMDVYEIVDKVLSESTINESFLSPAELKKKLQRVAMKWASEEGIKYEVAYNDLRKRKSVKDMLDFYTVDEIIDDLKKKKKEVDDELEEEI